MSKWGMNVMSEVALGTLGVDVTVVRPGLNRSSD